MRIISSHFRYTFGLLFCFTLSSKLLFGQTTSTFESLPLEENTYWNGSTIPQGTTFEDGNAVFHNFFDTTFGGYWIGGWAYSNVQDTVTAGFSNLYASVTGSGYQSETYAIGTFNAVLRLKEEAIGKQISGLYVTNATVAALSMRDGDAIAKKFGGVSGDDPDWFKLSVGGWFNGVVINERVELYLADFRFDDNTQDYILKQWQWLDLTPSVTQTA